MEIDLSVVFRIMGESKKGEDPELVRDFVYRVTPKGLETQLRDAGEEAVRSLGRSILHTEGRFAPLLHLSSFGSSTPLPLPLSILSVYGLRNTAGKTSNVPVASTQA